MGKQKVIFLCTGNSCRSQMAEGFLRNIADDRYEVFSAGLEPKQVNPYAIKVMQEDGIDISHHKSKDLKNYLGRVNFSKAVFVCHNAEQNCPSIYPFAFEKLSWPFEDPAAFEGDEESTLNKFREIRDQIKNRIQNWLEEANAFNGEAQ
ncbi:MAG: arsenate reductase ArsC [candidate division Zixibacteria bacterium]|nr:arsenate reductase ArsC [candidate division Zixibacteria bacterium]